MEKKKMSVEERAMRMGTENLWSLIAAMAVPAVFANLSSAIYNLVDRLFMGQFVGRNALGAISLTSPLISVMAGLSLLITIGGAALLSMNLGSGNLLKAKKLFTNMMIQAAATSFVLAVVYFAFAPSIIRLCGADEASALYAPAVRYLRIISFGLMFQLLNAVQASVIRAEGNTQYSMCVSILGGIVNIFLDALFVAGFDMGLEGAAVATVISQMISAFASSMYFIRKKSLVNWLGFQAADIRENIAIMKNGAAPAILQLLIFITGLLVNHSLRKYGDLRMIGGGDLAISAMSVISTSETLNHTVIMGINQGTSPIISFNYGAKKYQRVLKASMIAQLLAMLIAVFTWGLMMFAPGVLFQIFAPGDAEILEYGTKAMRLAKMFIFLSGIQTLSPMFFSAIGRPKTAAVMSVVKQAVFFVPALLLLPRFMGIDGTMLAYAVSDIFSTIIIVLFYVKGLRRLRLEAADTGTGMESGRSMGISVQKCAD